MESAHSGSLHCSTRLLLLVLDQRTGAPFEVEGPSAQGGRYPSFHRLMNQILLLITSVGRQITQHRWSSGFLSPPVTENAAIQILQVLDLSPRKPQHTINVQAKKKMSPSWRRNQERCSDSQRHNTDM